jgi:hypothetical protein
LGGCIESADVRGGGHLGVQPATRLASERKAKQRP